MTIERIALLGVGHHHTGLVAEGLRAQGRRVVAISDFDPELSRRWAEALGCRAYKDHRALLDRERIDFAFAFGAHRAMPALALELIDRGVPFSIEKPLGIAAADVERVHARQVASGLFVAIPFVFRCSPMLEWLRALADTGRIGAPLHMRFVDLAGSPNRYVGVAPWLLDREAAGGGCFINLAVHFVDLFILLGRQSPEVVGSRYSNAVFRLPVEDHALVLLANAAGGTCSIEVGYTFPDDARRMQSYGFAGVGWHIQVGNGRGRLDQAGGTEEVNLVTDTNAYYAMYVRDTLEACAAGRPPPATPRDLLSVMQVVDRANAQGAPQLLPALRISAPDGGGDPAATT